MKRALFLLLIIVCISFADNYVIPVNISVWYPLAMNRTPEEEVYVNFGVFYSNYGGLHGIDATGLLSKINGNVNGVAATGIGIVYDLDAKGVMASGIAIIGGGNSRGITASGLASINGGHISGVHASGLLSVCGGSVLGLQATGGASIAGSSVRGIQCAGAFALNGGHFRGLQAAGGFVVCGESIRGIQTAGAFARCGGSIKGLQASCVNISEKGVNGLQTAVVNLCGNNLVGLQAGVVNIAGESRGVQAGVVNVAGIQHGMPIGLINLSSNGDFEVVTYGSNLMGVNIGTKFTSNDWYSEFGIGYSNIEKSVTKSLSTFVYYGHHFPFSRNLYMDLDAGYVWIDNDKIFNNDGPQESRDQMASSIRGRLGLSMNKWGVFAGIGLNHIYNAELQCEDCEDFNWKFEDGEFKPYFFGGVSIF